MAIIHSIYGEYILPQQKCTFLKELWFSAILIIEWLQMLMLTKSVISRGKQYPISWWIWCWCERFSIIPVKEILRQWQHYMSNILELAVFSISHQYGCNDQNTVFSDSNIRWALHAIIFFSAYRYVLLHQQNAG